MISFAKLCFPVPRNLWLVYCRSEWRRKRRLCNLWNDSPCVWNTKSVQCVYEGRTKCSVGRSLSPAVLGHGVNTR